MRASLPRRRGRFEALSYPVARFPAAGDSLPNPINRLARHRHELLVLQRAARMTGIDGHDQRLGYLIGQPELLAWRDRPVLSMAWPRQPGVLTVERSATKVFASFVNSSSPMSMPRIGRHVIAYGAQRTMARCRDDAEASRSTIRLARPGVRRTRRRS